MMNWLPRRLPQIIAKMAAWHAFRGVLKVAGLAWPHLDWNGARYD